MNAGVLGTVMPSFPRAQKTLQFIGLITASLAFVASAFVTKPWHLIVTVGILYPFSGAAYLPCATLLFEWFHARSGLASGIMFAGTGVGGVIFPFMVSGLLNRFGYKVAMISIGLGFGIVTCTCLVFVKRRIPLTSRSHESQRRPTRKIDYSFTWSRLMMAGISTILLISLGTFIPSLWLPSFATDLKLKHPNGVALISIMNAASVPGNAILGFVSDRMPLQLVMLVSTGGTALACFFLWGFGTSGIVLVFFSLIFGLLGLGFPALWSKMISMIARDEPSAPAMIFSTFAFIRGVGSFTSGPISDALLKFDTLRGAPGAYGFRNYGILLLYAALTISLGGASGLAFNSKKTPST